MVVIIKMTRIGFGHQLLTLDLEDAKREMELAEKEGYLISYNNKQVPSSEIVDDQEYRVVPAPRGG